MDKKDIIRSFAKRGVLLSPRTLDELDDNNLERILDLASHKTEPVLKDITESGLSVALRKTKKRKKLGVKDFVKYYNKKYSSIRDIVSKKTHAMSINNARNSFSSVSVIGMIKDITPKGFIIEDQTGEIEVIDIKQRRPQAIPINPDDVVGVTGNVKENRLFLNDVVFPDIPLSNQTAKINADIILSSKITDSVMQNSKEASFIVVPGLKQNPNPDRVLSGFDMPAWITIYRGESSATLLVHAPKKQANPQEAIAWLKKRHLCPGREDITSPDDVFMIKPIPAVFWILQDATWNENYKGVNIISCGRDSFAKVSLWSLETKFYPLEKPKT